MESHKVFLQREIERFSEQFQYLKPARREIPELNGIDIYGTSLYLHSIAGGDHITFVDFNKRYDLEKRITKSRAKINKNNLKLNMKRAGIMIADASGHGLTDGMLVAQLHQAFLVGASYELEQFGEITANLFENLNNRFYHSSSTSDYITMLYGEISDKGVFRFISAAHPPPLVFCSDSDQLMSIDQSKISISQPIGFIPSRHSLDIKKNYNPVGFEANYEINELKRPCTAGIYLLYTDGLSEHFEESFEEEMELILKESKNFRATTIFNRIERRIHELKEPEDDISYVVVKFSI
ncbi:PP2C family protein-serine/threonine phosphatase [Candidatus Neomarinimicrobiota bacterium]